ncbi:cyclic pyranopterin phosphate synthase [Arthrobacter stackebrandtii]|uniref:GTP 3',8-cyclase n=1 Tax=Arthrobacter stackebrandtii TaxID=272161 RepID=A0ABS4YUZ1_9MICC|nr:GTP 3',8-cyclase MoaA [Arthrobacter stackebrandtii]MBP2411748.1 cyclic pyranopterin phosphate synthase [Arthrobacter stackebrandtii]PYG99145.1 GTP 3',8-cyclase MoaA [Arthrobacter stackebrandtii]
MAAPLMTDKLRRPLRDLRISVTDRCNFRCVYCMPKEIFGRDFVFMPHDQLLTFEEITTLARIAVGHGVHKIRLTGGEPLLRRGIEDLVRMLAELRTPDGQAPDLAMTTNGSVLAQKAEALKAAGLDRVTVSLDSLDDGVFQAMNDVAYPVAKVLHAIDAAQEAGLGPVKVNMVVKRGLNDHSIVEMARHFRGTGIILRFIEYMDVGTSNGWEMGQVVSSAEVMERINEVFPVEPLDANYAGETAQRWRYVDGAGEIGAISSVTRAFCGGCTRARLSADGKLFTCLFATKGTDLRALLRDGATDGELAGALGALWGARTDRYSELRSASTPGMKKIEMNYIGG